MLNLFLFICLLCNIGVWCRRNDLQYALKAIEERQQNYHPKKNDPEPIQSEDDLMYLANSPGEIRDVGQRENIGYGYQKPSYPKNFGVMNEEILPESEFDNYGDRERYLKERLMEKMVLDYLQNEDDNKHDNHHAKRSFFREREESNIPESLQSLYSIDDPDRLSGEGLYLAPSSFRERVKPKLHDKSYRQLMQFYEPSEGQENTDDYLMALNSLWEKYKDASVQNVDPESLTDEDIQDFLKFLNEKDERKRQNEDYHIQDGYIKPSFWEKRLNADASEDSRSLAYLHSPYEFTPIRNKKYWLGSKNTNGNRAFLSDQLTIKKRSPAMPIGGLRGVVKRYGTGSSGPTTSTNPDPEFVSNPTKTTDPEVAKELNQIFGGGAINNNSFVLPSSSNRTSSKLGKLKLSKQKLNETFALKKNAGKGKGKMDKGQKEESQELLPDTPVKVIKKAVDWSNYFGMDKRQPKEPINDNSKPKSYLLDQYVQSYVLPSVGKSRLNRPSDYAKKSDVLSRHHYGSYDGFPNNVRYDEPKKESKTALDLEAAEEAIIEGVLKFIGANEGIVNNPAQFKGFREKILSQLAAAYSLEKWRQKINEKHSQTESKLSQKHIEVETDEKEKRTAMKKDNGGGEVLPNYIPGAKKNNVTFLEGIVKTTEDGVSRQIEPMSGYHGGHATHVTDGKKKNIYTNEVLENGKCPGFDYMVKKCYDIASLAKDHDNTFFPFCALYQICNVCVQGNSEFEEACDINFISEAVAVCGGALWCESTAGGVFHTMQKLKKNLELLTCDPCLTDSFEKLVLN